MAAKSPILDRNLACLTPHRSSYTFVIHETGRLKFLFANSKCRLKDNKVQGNKVSWQMECDGGMTGSGEMTYQADSNEGMMKMKAPSMDLSTRYSGKRVGDYK